jgi:O-antigen ligase
LAFKPLAPLRLRVLFASSQEAWRPIWFGLAAAGVGIVGGITAVALPNPLIGLGAAIGGVLAFVMLTRPLFTTATVAVVSTLLPFGVIPVKLGLTFSLLEASLLILFLVWLVRLALRAPGQEQIVAAPFNWAVSLFIGLCFFSLIMGWSSLHDLDLHNFFKLLLSILSFFAIINLVRTQAALETMLRVVMLAGSGAALIAVVLYRLPFSLQDRLLLALRPLGYPVDRVLRFVEDDMQKPQRATGTSVDPNSFAGMLVLILALLFSQLISAKPLFKRWQLSLMLAVTALALFLTYSRAAMLLGVLGTLLFLALVKYRRIWVYAVPVGVLGALILPNTPLWERFAGGFALSDPATIMRLHEYSNALDIIKQYPWFGVGFGHAPTIDLTTGVSSVYLALGEQLGLLGLGMFLLVMLLFFIYVISNLTKVQDARATANLLGCASGVLGALATGALDYYFFDIRFPHMSALLWFIIALAVVQIKLATSSNASPMPLESQN